MTTTPQQNADSILSTAERELEKAKNISYQDDRDNWTAALLLVRCARLRLMPRDNDPGGALECCESASKLAALGSNQYFGEILQSVPSARKKISEAIDILKAMT